MLLAIEGTCGGGAGDHDVTDSEGGVLMMVVAEVPCRGDGLTCTSTRSSREEGILLPGPWG